MVDKIEELRQRTKTKMYINYDTLKAHLLESASIVQTRTFKEHIANKLAELEAIKNMCNPDMYFKAKRSLERTLKELDNGACPSTLNSCIY